MARNTLEAVFGALGAGLTGYGRERREREEAEEKRRRQALEETFKYADLQREGFYLPQSALEARQSTQAPESQVRRQMAQQPEVTSRVPLPEPDAIRRAPRVEPRIDFGGGREPLYLAETVPERRRREAQEAQDIALSERQADREVLRDILSTTPIPADLKPAVLSGNLTIAQALAEANRRKPSGGGAAQPTGTRPSDVSSRQTIARRAAENFINAAGGVNSEADIESVVDRAAKLYLQNPPQDLTDIKLALTRADLTAAARRSLGNRRPSDLEIFGNYSQPLSQPQSRTPIPPAPSGVNQREWEQYLRETGQLP